MEAQDLVGPNPQETMDKERRNLGVVQIGTTGEYLGGTALPQQVNPESEEHCWEACENYGDKPVKMKEEVLDNVSPEVWHQRFRNFCYEEAKGPRDVCLNLWELCYQWLRPETNTKEQILESLILEQFLAILPPEMQSWVRDQDPKTCTRAVALAEHFRHNSEEPEQKELESLTKMEEQDLFRPKSQDSIDKEPRNLHIVQNRATRKFMGEAAPPYQVEEEPGEQCWETYKNSRDTPVKVKVEVMEEDCVGSEVWRQRFRRFCYEEAEGPQEVFITLWELCCQWLRPEMHTKERILEFLMLEQFLAVLPPEMQSWVREQDPETCARAVALAERFLHNPEEPEQKMDNQQPGPSYYHSQKTLADYETEELMEESEARMVLSDSDDDPTYQPSESDNSSEEDARRPSPFSQTHRVQPPAHVQHVKGNRQPVWFRERDHPLAGNEPQFTGNHQVNIHGETPVDYFSQLFSDDLMKEIVEQTNLYACRQGKDNLGLTVPELKIYLGIVLVMTYIKYPRVREYWSSEHGLRMDIIANAMPVNRWEVIKRYLHFVDSDKIPPNNTDKAVRIRPVLQKFHETFHAAVSPEEFQSVGEMTIPFKGRSQLKQLLCKKTQKWGIKMWVRAGISGYVYCFDLDLGADPDRKDSHLFTASENVVLRLCHDLAGKNCKINADDFFTSIPLVKKLKEDGICFVGTCRRSRLQGADQKLKSEKDLQKMRPSSMSVTTSSDDITVTRWVDNSVVHTVSSYVGKEPIRVCKRFSRKEKKYVEIPLPRSVVVYNKPMGGVDLMNYLVALYRNETRNKRWYMRIFYHLLNVLICNVWIIWKWEGKKKLDLFQFKSRVATALIYQGSAELAKKSGRPSGQSPPLLKKRQTHSVPPEKRFDGGGHFPRKGTNANANRCRDVHCKSKTRYFCDRCEVPLCPECFRSFHTK